MQPDPVRTPGGAIDYDFYRDRARVLRERARRDAYRRVFTGLRSMVAALLGRPAARRS